VRRRSRRGADGAAPEVPLAPLIDMVFTILIFLLVTASFSKTAGLPLELPNGGREAESEAELAVSIDARLDLYVGDAPISLGALPRAVREARARDVVLRADRSAPAGLLADVYAALLDGGAERVVLATEAPR